MFSPLPCWAQLDPAVYGRRVIELVRAAVDEGPHQRAGRPVLGRKAVLAQNPHDEPMTHDRSPAPAVHAATKAIRIMLERPTGSLWLPIERRPRGCGEGIVSSGSYQGRSRPLFLRDA